MVSGIARALAQAETLQETLAAASRDAELSLVEGLDAPVLAALLERRAQRGAPAALLVVAPTGRRADDIGPALEALVPGALVLHLPAWETLPHERLSPSAETVGRRLDVLRRVAQGGRSPAPERPRLVVTTPVRGGRQPPPS